MDDKYRKTLNTKFMHGKQYTTIEQLQKGRSLAKAPQYRYALICKPITPTCSTPTTTSIVWQKPTKSLISRQALLKQRSSSIPQQI